MKTFIIFGILLLIPVIPLKSFSQKASTIDELIAMYDITPCAECHEDKHSEWKTSTMGNSVIDPRVLRGFRTFIKLELDQEKTLRRKDLTICLNCHVPHIKDASEELVVHIADLVITALEDKDSTRREAAEKELSKLNLNCLGCHNLKALGFNKEPEPGVIYVPDKINDDAHTEAGYRTITSEFMKTSDFCAQCHHCPPSVPWESCPTLYTTYIEDFIKKGRNETCQACHMEGKKRNHQFLGPDNLAFLQSAVTLNVNVRPTRYVDTYEGTMIPAIFLKVFLTNNTGHTIPHGCAFTPKAVLDVTAKSPDGDLLFSNKKVYHVGDLYFKGGKQVAMAEWDITATEHFDLGLKALETDTSTFIIPLKPDSKRADINVQFLYLYSRDKTIPVTSFSETVEIQ
jgi:hypothetical protein